MRIKFIILLLFFKVTLLYAQSNDTIPYNYPIKPYMDEWKALKNNNKYEVFNIPNKYAVNMQTKALALTCINYPFLWFLFGYNTPQRSIDEWRKIFNGVDLLFSRDDKIDVLFDVYLKFEIGGHKVFDVLLDKGNYICRLMILQMLISQKEIADSLSKETSGKFLKEALLKYDAMLADENYGYISIQTTARLIVIMAIKAEIAEPLLQEKELQGLISSGVVKNKETIDKLINNLKKLINAF